MNRKAIGIDIGTTTISGVILDIDQKKVMEAKTVKNDSFIKTKYEWERVQNVDVILYKAIELMDELLKRYPDVDAIGLTGQMHGIVYINDAGHHCSPLYTWQDGRGNLPAEYSQLMSGKLESWETRKSDLGKSGLEELQSREAESGKSEAWKLKLDVAGLRRSELEESKSEKSRQDELKSEKSLLQESVSGQSLVECIQIETGFSVATGYGLVTHLYNFRNGLVPAEAVSLCTISDYLGMILTGRKTPLMHASNAASLGFFDSQHGVFYSDVLGKMGLDSSMLPSLGKDSVELGTYQGIPVTIAIGDNQASFLGSVGMHNNTVLLNMGTGGQISVLSDRYFSVPGIEARPFFGGKYLLAGSSLCGGRAYAVLEHFFRSYLEQCGLEASSQYEVMDKLAEKAVYMRAKKNIESEENVSTKAGKDIETKDQLKVHTTFSGTRVYPEQRGSITNISEDNFTPEALTYGVLEGMAQELYELYEQMRCGTDIEAEHLVASGNGFRRNPVLQDICREKFGADLILSPFEEEAASGAAIHAMMI